MDFSNSNATTSPFSNPNDPTNGAFADGESYSSGPSSTESATEIQWKTIITMLIAFLGILMLFVVLYQACRERQSSNNPKRTNIDNDDPERAAGNEEAVADNSSSSFNRTLLVIPLLATLLATILSIITHTSCELIDFIDGSPFVLSLGLWKARFQYKATLVGDDFPPYQYEYEYVSGGECRSNFRTDQYEQDAPLVNARVAATLATVMGGIGFLLLVHSYFRATNSKGISCWLKPLFLLTTGLQLVPLCIMNTELCSNNRDDCFVNIGLIVTILASYFWGFACFALVLLI